MIDALGYLLVVGILAVVAVRIGMLMASTVGRLADRIDADPDDPPPGGQPRDDA